MFLFLLFFMKYIYLDTYIKSVYNQQDGHYLLKFEIIYRQYLYIYIYKDCEYVCVILYVHRYIHTHLV